MAQPNERQKYLLHVMGIDPWRERTSHPARATEPPRRQDQRESALRADTPGVSQPGIGRPPPPAIAAPEISSCDWQGLEAAVAACTLCSLCESRNRTVFGVGNRSATWMFIGEAPGAEEDRRGEPFVGRAGQLLDAMLRSVGLDRNQAFIANVLKCRPPGNRDPRQEEAELCSSYLNRQIALVKPELLVAVGRIAAQRLLNTGDSLARLRGRVHHYGAMNTPLIVTYHPAYLLRSPAQKRKAWEDLLLGRRTVAGG